VRNWRLSAALAVLASAVGAFYWLAPAIVDSRLNLVKPHAPWPADAAARALHRQLVVADLHADSLLWGRDLLRRNARGQVDFPRLREGNVALQVLDAVTRSPRGQNYRRNSRDAPDNIRLQAMVQLWPLASWDSLAERALFMAARLDELAERAPQAVLRVHNRADLEDLLDRREQGEELTGVVLGTEGSHALDGKLENIARLREAGYRIMGLQHFFDNELGGSLHGESRAGLSDFGRRAVAEMQRQGIIVDVAHSAPAVVEDVLAMTKAPVILSHTGVHGHCPGPRNIPDALLKRIADGGGLVGIGFWQEAVCDDSPAGIAGAIEAAVKLLGPRAVALGSDFDGAVTTSLDSSELVALTAALQARGMDEQTIAAVMGGNQVRFLREHLPP